MDHLSPGHICGDFPAEETVPGRNRDPKLLCAEVGYSKGPPSLELMDSWNRQGLQRQKMGSGQTNGV